MKRISSGLLNRLNPSSNVIYTRNKHILKRENEPFLGSPRTSPYIVGPYVKEIMPEDPWLLPRSGVDDVYEVLGNTLKLEKKNIKVILIDHVPGVGLKGNRVSVDPDFAFHKLIPEKKAIYDSEINSELYKDLINSVTTGGPSSILSALTAVKLESKIFSIEMSNENEWKLEAKHVRNHLRRQGLIVPQDAIEMPEQAICGPNLDLEGKDFFVYITINNNKYERVPVHCTLHHIGLESGEDQDKKISKRSCILPEQQSLLDKKQIK